MTIHIYYASNLPKTYDIYYTLIIIIFGFAPNHFTSYNFETDS